jgi:hypothetical protein
MQHAFTTSYDGIARVLFNEVHISLPATLEELKGQGKELNKYVAIWDTGANNSCVTKKIVKDLGLKPTGIVEVRHAKGKSMTNTYLVNIILPSNVMIGQVRVTEVDLVPDMNVAIEKQPQVLIGMDIIGIGDFAVTNSDSKTTLSFRTPSVSKIDFISEANDNNIMTGGNRHDRRALLARQRKT